MKHHAIIIIQLLIVIGCYGQAPDFKWGKCYGGGLNDVGVQMVPYGSDGFLFAANTFSGNGDVVGNHGNTDMWLVACDASGSIDWQRCLGGSFADRVGGIQRLADGTLLAGGTSASSDGDFTVNKGSGDCWMANLSDGGKLEWSNNFGGSYYEQCNKVLQMADGGYMMVGLTFSNDGDVEGLHGPENYMADAWIVRTDAERKILWQRCFGGTDADAAYSFAALDDGAVLVAAACNSVNGDIVNSKGNRDIWLIKFDGVGNIVWKKNFGGSFDDVPYSIARNKENGFVVAGFSYSGDGNLTNHYAGTSGADYEDGWVFCTDSLGQLLWQKNYGGTGSDVFNDIVVMEDGYLLTGETNSPDGDVNGTNGFKDYWLIKLTMSGDIIWQKTFGGSFFDFGKSSCILNDGSILATGFISGGGGNVDCYKANSDVWVIKLATSTLASKLSGVTATNENSMITVQWNISGSYEKETFVIEKSKDAIHFVETGRVYGVAHSGEYTYSYTDKYPFEGTSYYRVKQIDMNGSIFYSAVAMVKNDKTKNLFRVFPNPVLNGKFTVELANRAANLEAAIIDFSGKKVYTAVYNNVSKINFSVPYLKSGLYFLSITIDGETSFTKLIFK